MENAGREVASSALRAVRTSRIGRVLIVCGRGNNGGDGFVAARHLHNWGVHVSILALWPVSEMQGDARTNAEVVGAMGLPWFGADAKGPDAALRAIRDPGVIVDAIFGTGLDRPVDGLSARVIRWMNGWSRGHGSPVVAVDLPSGMDCDSGERLGPTVQATTTMTLVGPKVGFKNPAARESTGSVRVGDIGVPRELAEGLAQRTGA